MCGKTYLPFDFIFFLLGQFKENILLDTVLTQRNTFTLDCMPDEDEKKNTL